MKNSPILFREESKPPRLLTWPLVLLVAGAIAAARSREIPATQPALFPLYVVAAVFCTVLLLEFIAVTIEVTESEVLFCISPFYKRRIVIANIQHWEIRTYPSPAPRNARYSWRPPKLGIELAMKDRSVVTITSMHSERLSLAISEAKEISAGHELHSAGHHHPTRH